jgi:hypothetical protein
MKSEVYKKQVDKRDELFDRFVVAAVLVKETED